MKKLLFLMSVLFSGVVATMAQDEAAHWTFDANNWPGETVLYCDLVQEVATENFNPFIYDIAAFVKDENGKEEIRAIGEYTRDNRGVYFLVRVKGDDDDNGKEITFKAYNRSTKLEYNLAVKEEPLPITYDGETKDPGKPSNFRHLYISEMTNIALPASITLPKGETVDLKDYITLTPATATMPNNIVWDFANSSAFISVEGYTLKGLAPTDGTYLGLSAGALSASTTVIVINLATAITIKNDHKEITVNKNDAETLTDFLNNAYALTPGDATDKVTWDIQDPTIVENLAPTAVGYNPKAKGTTTLKAQILNDDNSVRLEAAQTVTVNVIVPVERIDLSIPSGGINCNVGDDLTEYLRSIVSIYPGDASKPDFTWSVVGGNAVTISKKGVIKAVAAGSVKMQVTSNENPDIDNALGITVHNPATDVTFTNTTVNGTYYNSNADISQAIIDNIHFQPTGFESIDNLTIQSDKEGVVTIENPSYSVDTGKLTLTATAKGAGEATVTVSFTYTDYLKGYTEPEESNTITISKTFKVSIAQGLTGFSIQADDLLFNKSSHITLTPIPANATFDATKVSIIVKSSSQLPESWTQTVDGGKSTDGQVVFTFAPNVPGPVKIAVIYKEGNISNGRSDVGVPFSLGSGWQWRTLYYGNVSGGYLEEAFGDDQLVEIRSQYSLLYNDPVYGYFGDLATAGVSQDVCYKIKTTGALEEHYVFENGDLQTSPLAVSINDGWTWMPNPYLYSRPLAGIMVGIGEEGDRIVSKDNGFAEHDGTTWVGSLKTLEPGQGYLYFRNGDATSISLPSEFDMEPGQSPSGSRQSQEQSVWHYDASNFRDNMTIVAKVADESDMSSYTVGAFVGNECRGEGKIIDGYLFMTVHGQSGDQISFRFHDIYTKEEFMALETMKFKFMAGTLKAPVTLTRDGSTVGIRNYEYDQATEEVFSTSGLRTSHLKKGINIIRMSDGSVRKVIRK